MIIKALTAMFALAFVIVGCAVVRKAQQYDAADDVAGLERCVKVMVLMGIFGVLAALAYVAA